MGLDMYLSKINRDVFGYRNVNLAEEKEKNSELYQKLKPHIFVNGNPGVYEWESLEGELAYWRKANQIHNWFVSNVQDGEDDCGSYEVSKEQLENLLNTCLTVVNSTVMMAGKVVNGYSFNEKGKMAPCYEAGKVVINPEVAEELLPSVGGFFFGSTDYDNYYIDDVVSTITQITKVLSEVDFDKEIVLYHASW